MEQAHPDTRFDSEDVSSHESSKGLSKRATQLLILASEGKTNKEIAQNLGITEDTVDWHWKRIKETLGTVDRTQSVCRGLSLAFHEKLRKANEELEKFRRREVQLRIAQSRLTELLVEAQKESVEVQARSLSVELLLRASNAARAVAYELDSFNPVSYRKFSPSASVLGIDADKTIRGEKSFFDLISTEDLTELYTCAAPSQPAFEPGVCYLHLFRLTTNEKRWILDIQQADFDSAGQVCGVLGLAIDVHDLVLAGALEGKVGRFKSSLSLKQSNRHDIS